MDTLTARRAAQHPDHGAVLVGAAGTLQPPTRLVLQPGEARRVWGRGGGGMIREDELANTFETLVRQDGLT